MQSSNVQRRESQEVLYERGSACAVKRNPYLVDFEAQRTLDNFALSGAQTEDTWPRAGQPSAQQAAA